MEEQVERLVENAWEKYEQLPQDQRLLIGIAGIPGSGKTTLASMVAQRLQTRNQQSSSSASPLFALPVSMDGFHFTRATLSAMPDPDNAHARRGAAFTFNAEKFLALVTNLRNPPTEPIAAPTFDHALKDPVEGDLIIPQSTRIVLVEGNYLALDEPVWRDARALFDEVWFVEVDVEVARRRLRERHVRAGIAKTIEEGDKRAMENDLPNGEEITSKRLPVDEIIYSKEDGSWVHE